MPDNRELKHALYRIAAVGVLVPPVVAATLIAVAGSYPMPEGYLSLLGYTGIYFAIAAVLAFGLVVPRAYRTFTKLGAMPAPDATHPESAARRELARECDFAENVLRTVPVIVLLLDPSGRIRYCNAHFERLTGYRLEEIRGESSFSRFVPPGEQEEIRRVLEAAVAGYQTNGNVNSLLTRDGAEREIEWHVRPLLDEHGEVENLVSVGLDVTESSRLIRELRESERHLNEAQRLAKTGSWELDAANGSLNWSDETYRIVERDRESFEPSYEAVLEMTHPDDRLRVERAYRRSLETGEPYEITHRIQTPGGGVKYVLETGSGQFDDSGRLLRSSGTVQDITELQLARRELECYRDHLEELVEERTAELREEHRRHSFIVNAAVDGFFIADEEGKLTECNQAFCSMLGYTREELLSLSIPDLEAIQNEDDVAAHIAELIEQGHVRFDTRHRRKDGTEIDVEIQATYRFLEGGSYELYVFVHDISKRVERARELAASRDEAERANRAKSEFLSRMSHDLRTPLNAILGFAELLESDVAEPLTETQADNIGEVLKAGRHLLSMIDDILDLSRADQGRLEVDAKNVDLPAVLSEVAAELEAVAARRNVEVATSLGGLGMARADERRIRQVLSILL
ncbi:MAG: PAS domain S-box protein, partial [Spirochaetaceae bacterium]